MNSYLAMPNDTLTVISSSGSPTTGFEAANVLTSRQGEYWLVPSGGPHTITIEWTGGPDPIFIASPAGIPIIGDVTVDLTQDFGGANDTTGPYTLPRYTSDLLRDQRIFVPTGLTDYGSVVNRATLTFASGSAVSRIILPGLTAYSEDLLGFLNRGWTITTKPVIRQASNSNAGHYATADFESAPVRYRIISGIYQNRLYSSLQNFALKNMYNTREGILMQNVAAYGDVPLTKLMHKHSILCRMTAPLGFDMADLNQNYSCNLQFKELV